MLTITVDRTSLSLTALVAADSGATAAEVVAWDPGQVQPSNTYARSRWISGAALTSSTDDLITATLVVRVQGSSVDNVVSIAEAWSTALRQFAFTVTETIGTTAYVYDCCPAAVGIPRDPDLLNGGYFMTVTAQIPRQP